MIYPHKHIRAENKTEKKNNIRSIGTFDTNFINRKSGTTQKVMPLSFSTSLQFLGIVPLALNFYLRFFLEECYLHDEALLIFVRTNTHVASVT